MSKNEMSSRERVWTAISCHEPDRVPSFDTPWTATVQRWYREGLPEGVDPREYFDFDIVQVGVDLSPRYPVYTIQETDKFIIETNNIGGTWRNRHGLG